MLVGPPTPSRCRWLVVGAAIVAMAAPLAACGSSESGPLARWPRVEIGKKRSLVAVEAGRLLAVVPDGDKVVGFSTLGHGTTRLRVPEGVHAVAAKDGDLWVDGRGRTNETTNSWFVYRVDARTGKVLAEIDPNPIQILYSLVGADGSIWGVGVSDDDDRGYVVRVDPKTDQIIATITVPSDVGSIAVRADAVWVTGANGQMLTRIDPTTNRVVARIKVGWGPQGVAADAGSVWVPLYRGELVRVDATTNRVVGRTEIGDALHSVAAGGGSVWVTNARKLEDNPDPPDHQWLFQVDPATGHVRERYDFPDEGLALGDPVVVAAGEEVWAQFAGTAYQVSAP